MKLSLTAIAALFATTLHSSVATGTRAASSNGNTNAAEDKPGRDLEDFEDLVGTTLIADGSFAVKAGFAGGALVDYMQIKYMTGCALGMLGEQVESQWRLRVDEGSGLHLFADNDPLGMILILIFADFAGGDGWIDEDELLNLFIALPEAKRGMLWSAMKDICAVGWHGGFK